jgi:hypothetical protein
LILLISCVCVRWILHHCHGREPNIMIFIPDLSLVASALLYLLLYLLLYGIVYMYTVPVPVPATVWCTVPAPLVLVYIWIAGLY